MLEQVERYCVKHALLRTGDGIVAACSGGADSLALLLLLWQLRKKYGVRIVAAHFEHGIRGEESLADAAYVKDFCAARKIPFAVASADVPAEAAARGLSLETAARELRYAFLERVRQERRFDSIAVAHHADDQSETVLMRLLRGTGTQGLAAMRPRSGAQGQIIRPLLGVTKAEIRAWCRRNHLQPREDSTNQQADCTRNRLRLLTMPQLRQEYNPELSRALCQLAEVAAAEGEYLDRQVNALWQDAGVVQKEPEFALRQKGVAAQPLALQRRIIRRFWQEITGSPQDLGFVQAESLRELCIAGNTGGRQELPAGWTASVSYGRLVCRRLPAKDLAIPSPAVLQIPGETRWGDYCCQAQWRKSMPEHTGSLECCLKPEQVPGQMVIRSREAGDTMLLKGGRKKLKKLLIDDKIPQAERDRIPLLAAGQEILWVVGHRRSHLCRMDKDTTEDERILYLKMERREEFCHDE